MKPAWIRVARYAGIDPDVDQIDLMDRYGSWLSGEGQMAGGIGPAEMGRIDRRHLADSLLFASQLPDGYETVWDLGSGVGLPAIPLAICMPGREFVLIDRSGRRCDLMRRVIRVLGLSNCSVMESDVTNLTGETGIIVSRACLPPDRLRPVVKRHLSPKGVAVIAGSWQQRPELTGWDIVEIPAHVLDQTIWLLIMRRQ